MIDLFAKYAGAPLPLDDTNDGTPRLARQCCGRALAGQWGAGRRLVCGQCFTVYSATTVDGVPSWWTGLLP